MYEVGFLFSSILFVLIMVQLSAIIGTPILIGASSSYTLPAAPTNVLDALVYVVNNVGIFFQLMFISSSYTILGVIFTAIALVDFYIILGLIRGGK